MRPLSHYETVTLKSRLEPELTAKYGVKQIDTTDGVFSGDPAARRQLTRDAQDRIREIGQPAPRFGNRPASAGGFGSVDVRSGEPKIDDPDIDPDSRIDDPDIDPDSRIDDPDIDPDVRLDKTDTRIDLSLIHI